MERDQFLINEVNDPLCRSVTQAAMQRQSKIAGYLQIPRTAMPRCDVKNNRNGPRTRKDEPGTEALLCVFPFFFTPVEQQNQGRSLIARTQRIDADGWSGQSRIKAWCGHQCSWTVVTNMKWWMYVHASCGEPKSNKASRSGKNGHKREHSTVKGWRAANTALFCRFEDGRRPKGEGLGRWKKKKTRKEVVEEEDEDPGGGRRMG